MGEDLRGLVFEVAPSGDPDQPRWGWVGLVSSARGLRLLTLPSKSRETALARIRRHYADVALAPDDPFLCQVADQVHGYLMGQLTDFKVDLDLRGNSTFELTVWAATAAHPLWGNPHLWLDCRAGGRRTRQRPGCRRSPG